MKKISLLTAITIMFATHISAQIDTLRIGDRVPNYYYWDTNWWDHYFLKYLSTVNASRYYPPLCDSIMFHCGVSGWHDRCKVERARYIYTDTALRIIGIAAVMKVSMGGNLEDLMFPEYYRLYDVGREGMEDSMYLMAETRWDTTEIKRYMQVEHYYIYDPIIDTQTGSAKVNYSTLRTVEPVYEAYFDSPITVTDSFYVSATNNNAFNDYYKVTDWLGDVHYALDENLPRTGVVTVGCYGTEDTEAYEIWPKPQIHRYRAHYIGVPYNWDFEDTLWHSDNQWAIGNGFQCIFPIFDTTSDHTPPTPADSCPVPQHLRVQVSDYNLGNAYLYWDNDSAVAQWQVSICRDGYSADQGQTTTVQTSFIDVDGLDTAQWYTARVRAVCDSANLSEWSDSIRFYIPGRNQQGTEMTTTVTDRFTTLSPNPANSQITIISSFILRSVEIFAPNGHLVAKQKVTNKITTQIPIGHLPVGTYIVRISTTNGTAYKRLIVK